jgi:hypothetical protein
MKSFARKLRKLLYFSGTRVLLLVTRGVLRFSRTRLVLSNDTYSKVDGTGAQIQRLLSLYSLSREIKIDFLRQPFVDVSVHPLDPFQDDRSKAAFVAQMNHLFELVEDSPISDSRTISLQTLNVWTLFKFSLLCLQNRNPIVLSVVEAYLITDHYPDIACGIVDSLPNWAVYADSRAQALGKPLASIHYRQGVGGLVLYPGQNIPRELPPSYFYSQLMNLFSDFDKNPTVHLFTDAPLEDMIYEPDVQQHEHWESTPGFEKGLMQIKGNNLDAFFRDRKIDIVVHRGGNPLDAIAIMSKSDYLITSRSSLSYVAGLLNTSGSVVAADQFWHPSPTPWISS